MQAFPPSRMDGLSRMWPLLREPAGIPLLRLEPGLRPKMAEPAVHTENPGQPDVPETAGFLGGKLGC